MRPFSDLALHTPRLLLRPLAADEHLRQGFVREGGLRERWIVGGEVSDSALYGLLARDWHTGRGAA